jgi:hypothetical protein
MRPAIVALAAFLPFGTSAAQLTQEDVVAAGREVAGELQQCSVYFILSSNCIGSQDPALARDYRTAADRFGALSLRGGRAAGQSDDAYRAMASLLMEGMMNAIQQSCVNAAVLVRKYASFCQRLGQDVDVRLKEWMACKEAQRSPCPGGPL